MSADGYVELSRAVDTIKVGKRFREEGDVSDLVGSFKLVGMLQPITITPDGVLICGARRLAAAKQLGWSTVKVWVRSGISTRLEMALAERDENVVRRNFTEWELSRLYAELKTLLAEDAAQRKAATRFGATPSPGEPIVGSPGNSAKQAALAVTGKRSETTLERVLEIERMAEDPELPGAVRSTAVAQVGALKEKNANVALAYGEVQKSLAMYELAELLLDPEITETLRDEIERRHRELEESTTGVEMMALAKAALRRAKEARRRPGKGLPADAPAGRYPPVNPSRWIPKAFMSLVSETDYWWLRVDAAEVGASLGEHQWAQFDDWVNQAVAFRDAARQHRRG